MTTELIKRVKSALLNLHSTGVGISDKDVELINSLIEEAYSEATSEEKEQLDLMKEKFVEDERLQ